MKIYVKYVYIILSILFLIYLFLPNPEFPEPPANSLRSNEPADIEDVNRRAYFTDLSRSEVIEWYKMQFNTKPHILIKYFSLNFNYPPEESQTIIRDQTRSTFLEELTHPFRESIFINGFEPKLDNEAILIEEKVWRQKIIVKYIPSNIVKRSVIGIMTVFMIPMVFINFFKAIKELFILLKKKFIERNSYEN